MRRIRLYPGTDLVIAGGMSGFESHGNRFSLTAVLGEMLRGFDAQYVTVKMERAGVTPQMLADAWYIDAEWYHLGLLITSRPDGLKRIIASRGTSRGVASHAVAKFPAWASSLRVFLNNNREQISGGALEKIRDSAGCAQAAHAIGIEIPRMVRELYVDRIMMPKIRRYVEAAVQ